MLARFEELGKDLAYHTATFGILNNDVVGLTEEQRTAVQFLAALSIVTEGPAVYRNFTYPRWQNFYGRCQVMSGAFVVEDVTLKYLNQQLYRFRHPEPGINETIGCYIKALGGAMSPPIVIITNTVLEREPITSLRFKLSEGIQANLVLSWETFDAKCGGNILQPEAAQGQPPDPKNSGYNPGDRPGDQKGDPKDNSPNDGANTGPGDVDPPVPGGPGTGGTWKVQLQYFSNPPDCAPQSGFHDIGVTDPAAKITAFTEDVVPTEPGCGTTVKRLKAFNNGVDLNIDSGVRAPGLTVVGTAFF